MLNKRFTNKSRRLAATTAALPIFCLLAGCSAAASSNDASNAPAGAKTAQAIATSSVTDPTAFKLGTNLSSIFYWDGSRPFSNMIYGSDWQMQGPNGAEDVPATSLDANGWVKSVPAGYGVMRVLSIPAATADVVCHWQGNDNNSMWVVSNGVTSNVSRTVGANELRFTYTSGYPNNVWWAILKYNVDPTNYVRGIDCRETTASATDTLDPTFVKTVSGFKVIRFMKWMPSVEANSGTQAAFPAPTITWATRNKPGDGDYGKNDGVPVEQMVGLANQVGADPWFAMPWNADDDYITRFATYVRDNLAAGRQVYVETSNEVWNPGYLVYHQAAAEGAAEGLPGNVGGAFQQAAERYGEKTQHVMDLWSTVFAGQTGRLVRVAAFQNVQPYYGETMLTFNNTYQHVDAYATAPYWAFMDTDYTGQTLDQLMNTVLPGKITETLGFATQNKQLATKYGLRYVTYEAGQHIVLRNNVSLLTQIERDSRMYDLYKSYISSWQSQIGDTLTLFALTGPITQYGAWGMTEYEGQPVIQTPKLSAVQYFLGITTASTTPTTTPTPTTQVCPDGTVILSTSTCPTPAPTPTSPSKRRGVGNGGGSKATATA